MRPFDPPLVVLTDRRPCDERGRTLVETVRQAIAGGARVVILREKDLPRAERARLAHELRQVVPCLIIASDTSVADEVGADGVHIAATDPWPGQSSERPTGSGLLVGRSCHDHAEVAGATNHNATYVTLSPIFSSRSKPGYGPTLGPGALAGHRVPVIALGGIEPGNAAPCLAAGAAGVASMGAVMGAADPGHVVQRFLDELDRSSLDDDRDDDRDDTIDRIDTIDTAETPHQEGSPR